MSLLADLRALIAPPRAPVEPYRCNAARLGGFCAGFMQPGDVDPTDGVLFRCTICHREAYE